MLVSYRELGLDVDELEEVARPWTERPDIPVGEGGRNVITWGKHKGSYSSWFDSRGEQFQRNVVGPKRLELIKAGKVKFGDLVDPQTGRLIPWKELKGASGVKGFGSGVVVGGSAAPSFPPFTPAKTIKEAEQKARELFRSDSVDFSKTDIIMANTITRELYDLSNTYKINKIDMIAPYTKGKRSLGYKVKRGSADKTFFEVVSSTDVKTGSQSVVLLYSEKTAGSVSTAQKTVKKMHDAGLIKNASIKDCVTHEFGHILDVTRAKKWTSPSTDLQEFIQKRFTDHYEIQGFRNKIAQEVGSYINTNTSEFFAETFRLYKTNTLPKDMQFIKPFMDGIK